MKTQKAPLSSPSDLILATLALMISIVVLLAVYFNFIGAFEELNHINDQTTFAVLFVTGILGILITLTSVNNKRKSKIIKRPFALDQKIKIAAAGIMSLVALVSFFGIMYS